MLPSQRMPEMLPAAPAPAAGYRITACAANHDQAAFILSLPKREASDSTQETLRTSNFPSDQALSLPPARGLPYLTPACCHHGDVVAASMHCRQTAALSLLHALLTSRWQAPTHAYLACRVLCRSRRSGPRTSTLSTCPLDVQCHEWTRQYHSLGTMS